MFHEYLNVDHLIVSKKKIIGSVKQKKVYYYVILKKEIYDYFIEKNVKIMDEDEFPAFLIQEGKETLTHNISPSTDVDMFISVPKSVATKIKLMF